MPRKRGRESPLWIDVSAFIKRADDLLYRAKRDGRNRVVG
jgi:PleD family two-component response regulator